MTSRTPKSNRISQSGHCDEARQQDKIGVNADGRRGGGRTSTLVNLMIRRRYSSTVIAGGDLE